MFNVKVFLSPVQFAGTATSATVDSGLGATLTDSAIVGSFADDFFNLGTLEITSGAGLSGTESENIYSVTDHNYALGEVTISGEWNNGTPNSTTQYVLTSKKASPNPNDNISFAVERHIYSNLSTGGLSTGGGTTYVTDSGLVSAGFIDSSDFLGSYLLLLTGGGVDGIPRKITGYDETVGKITVGDSFTNEGPVAGDLYAVVRGPTQFQVSGEGVAPTFGAGNISNLSQVTSVDEALSINVNGAGEDLIHDDVFFVWIKRDITPNSDSFQNDNIIPNISFEI